MSDAEQIPDAMAQQPDGGSAPMDNGGMDQHGVASANSFNGQR